MLRRVLPLLGLIPLAACAPQVVLVQQQRCDTSFTVVNNSSYTVQELYFSPNSVRNWGPDQLGQNVLPPGRSTAYRAASEGGYDFRVVWNNGNSAELPNVDVCVASTITVTNGGLRAN